MSGAVFGVDGRDASVDHCDTLRVCGVDGDVVDRSDGNTCAVGRGVEWGRIPCGAAVERAVNCTIE